MAEDKPDGGRVESSPIDHPSDYPRQMQVNESLSDNNYIDWSQEMTNFLFAKNKIGFVDGTIKKPEPNSKDYMAWLRCDAMRMAKHRNGKRDLKQCKICEDCKRDVDGSSVSTYYTKLWNLWDELQSVLPTPKCTCEECTCDIGKKLVEIKEKERLYEFFLRLDVEFTTIRTQILSMSPTPNLGAAYHLASEDEQQRSIATCKNLTAETAAVHASALAKRDLSHRKISVQKEIKRNSGEVIEHCDFCGRDGRNRDGCFKQIGYHDWWPGNKGDKGKTKSAAHVDTDGSPIQGLSGKQYKQFMNLFNEAKKSDNGPKVNIVHGNPSANATAHELPVTIPNGESVAVDGKGDYVLPNGIKFENVLHDLRSRTLIGAGECNNGMYEIGMESPRQAMMTSADVWHKRLGHASDSELRYVSSLKDFLKNKEDIL